METSLHDRNFFHQPPKDFLLKQQKTFLFECQVFSMKKESVAKNKICFMRFYDEFILISQVRLQFFFFIFFKLECKFSFI